VNGETEAFGQRLTAAGAEIGANDFRISDMGPEGNGSFDAVGAKVAYNLQASEYLIVWDGDDNTGALVDDEREIFGQRVSASGSEVGTNDFRISDLGGPDGSSAFGAFEPNLAYNSQASEYAVVWWGDDNTAPLVDNEYEIFGQRLSASGAEVGANDFRISDMGPDGSPVFSAFEPNLAYNSQANDYLVVWYGDDNTAPLVDTESEVFGQQLLTSGVEAGANDFRISQMGPDGDVAFEGQSPTVAYGIAPNEYLIAWEGDTNVSPQTDDEFEIWARRAAPEPPPTAGPCTITGTAGNDVLTGTAGADLICALGGNDRVNGLGGNDTILLGAGNDRAIGAAGRDTIRGGTGADRISGGKGRDRLFGERGRDVLLARDRARDLVNGGRGFDRARVDRRRDVRRSLERLF
jgi:Ca2+-binding RTX toxin-like protein